MYLLDTNICIFAINKRPEGVLEVIKENLRKGLFISSLTIAELEFGIENTQKQSLARGTRSKRILLSGIVYFC